MRGRESIAASTELAVKYMHLHLLLDGLVRDKVLLMELVLGDGLAQPGDAALVDAGALSRLHRLIAAGEDMKVRLFALPVIHAILLCD